jgi:hypothetical protein
MTPPPAPTVVIDAPAADRASPLAPLMIDVCSHGIAEGRCVLASEGEDTDEAQARAVAILSWADAAHRVARVEVGLRLADRAQWLSRTIEFRAEDAPPERWRAVGLVIATLVGDVLHEQPPPPAPPPPAPAPPPAPEQAAAPVAAPVARRTHDLAWLDLGLLLAPGLDTGTARRGGSMHVSWAPWMPPVFVTLGASFAGAPGDGTTGVGATWTTISAGAGAVVSAFGQALRLDGRLEGVAQLLEASITAPAAADGSRWLGGGRIGLDVAWMPAASFGVVASAEGSLLSGATTIDVQGSPKGRDASNGLGFAGFLGIRGALR